MFTFNKLRLFLLGCSLVVSSSWLEAKEIKFATLAPEGSTWVKILREWNADLKKKTDGRLEFKIYSGGVSGDEKDVIRKIRFGQLDAGGFTGVGLGEIAPEERILDTPFLVQNDREMDDLYRTFDSLWRDSFSQKGFVLLGWAEVGPVYLFSKTPLQQLGDIKKIKMWMWEGDPIAEATFKALDASPVPLSIQDVLTALETGMIDGVYSSPLGIVALQWFTKMKFYYAEPLAYATGAVLLSKKSFDRLPLADQTILMDTAKTWLAQLVQETRKENQESLNLLSRNGVRPVYPKDAARLKQYEFIGAEARKELRGRLFDPSLENKVLARLKQLRGKK